MRITIYLQPTAHEHIAKGLPLHQFHFMAVPDCAPFNTATKEDLVVGVCEVDLAHLEASAPAHAIEQIEKEMHKKRNVLENELHPLRLRLESLRQITYEKEHKHVP
jgi:hypothetical protein